jgi:hypothetical protein
MPWWQDESGEHVSSLRMTLAFFGETSAHGFARVADSVTSRSWVRGVVYTAYVSLHSRTLYAPDHAPGCFTVRTYVDSSTDFTPPPFFLCVCEYLLIHPLFEAIAASVHSSTTHARTLAGLWCLGFSGSHTSQIW